MKNPNYRPTVIHFLMIPTNKFCCVEIWFCLKIPFSLISPPSLFLKVLGNISFWPPRVSHQETIFNQNTLWQCWRTVPKSGDWHFIKIYKYTHHCKINNFIASHRISNHNPSCCNDGSLNTDCVLRRRSFFKSLTSNVW